MTDWSPLFKGVDHASGTNNPDGVYPHLMVVQVVRVDLTDPDVHLFSTPPFSNYVAGLREVEGHTVSEFLRLNQLQVAINANHFSPTAYYLREGTPMAVLGLAVSNGTVVSSQESSERASVFAFDKNNHVSIIPTNWPASSTDGMYTAVAGDYAILEGGINVGYQYRDSPEAIHVTNPRTAFGLSQDKRFLFLLTVDGRQPDYSEGALDFETGAWLLLVGAYDAINLDGGGSTTLVAQNSLGQPVRSNQPSAVRDSDGRERTVGSHLGIFAKPALGFINDIVVSPDERTATVTWTTVAPALGQITYGASTNLGNMSLMETELATNHSMTLAKLNPSSLYYFEISARADGIEHFSPMRLFMTTNFGVTNILFDLTNSWKYTFTNQDGANWTVSTYNDDGWLGPSPAGFWAGNGPRISRNTQLPIDISISYPYPTYYFRTHFSFNEPVDGASLLFSAYVDDGAVFYLNGTELYRLRMPEIPIPIDNSTLALGYPCMGDATCSDQFGIFADLDGKLLQGDNVLAVEVHNYNPHSSDITFALRLAALIPKREETRLSFSYDHDQGILILESGRRF